MQIFLPFSDFEKVAGILDSKRLCKQIVEAWQIYTERTPNPNHPACLQWGQRKDELKLYILKMCEEYSKRYNKIHSIQEKILDDKVCIANKENEVPFEVRVSHCVNLIRKGVSVDILTIELNDLIGNYIAVDEFPDGYFWPVYKPKGTAEKHTIAWKAWFLNRINL